MPSLPRFTIDLVAYDHIESFASIPVSHTIFKVLENDPC